MSNRYSEDVIKHYRSLFSLPRLKTVMLIAFVICWFSVLLLKVLVGLEITASVILGLIFILIMFATAFLNSWIYADEKIIDFRRSLFLSLVGVSLFGLTSYIYSLAMKLFLGYLRIDHSVSIGASLYFALNLLIFGAISRGTALKKVSSALVGPIIMLIVIACLMPTYNVWRLFIIINHFFILSMFIMVLLALSFMIINKQAKDAIGFNTLTLFRAFMRDWIADEKEEVEKILSKLGEDYKTKTQVVVFRSDHGINGIFVVPNVHPGPFKNVGGSLLPTYLNKAIKDRYGAVSLIFHGVSTHSLDPTSYHESIKVVNATIDAIEKAKPVKKVSKLVRKSVNDRLLLTYQVLGVPVFFISSLSEVVEDFPSNVTTLLRDVTTRVKPNTCIVIDAHNRYGAAEVLSLDHYLLTKLTEAARALVDNTSIMTLDLLEAGFASTHLKDIGWTRGIGDAGIMFSALKVANELYGYVSIDGNNLVAGLREQIIALLRGLGYTDVEVCTTDTHGVTALISGKEYYAVGEGFNRQLLLDSIKEVAKKAMDNMEPVTIHVGEEEVTIKVIGGRMLTKICDVISKSVRVSKRVLSLTMTVYLIAAFIYLLVMV